jgi:hypothetical protein
MNLRRFSLVCEKRSEIIRFVRSVVTFVCGKYGLLSNMDGQGWPFLE